MENTKNNEQPVNLHDQDHVVGHKNCIHGLSWTKVVLASLVVLLSIAAIVVGAVDPYGDTRIGIDGMGIYLGIFMIVTGAMGIVAAQRSSKCFLIAYLVMTVIGAVTAAFVLSAAITWAINGSLSVDSYNSYDYRYDDRYPTYYRHYRTGYYAWAPYAIIGLEAFAALFAFVYFILSIVGSSIACCTVCGCCKTSTQRTYVTVPAQHVVELSTFNTEQTSSRAQSEENTKANQSSAQSASSSGFPGPSASLYPDAIRSEGPPPYDVEEKRDLP